MELGLLLSPRSVTDVIAKRVRVVIGEVECVLPVKSMRDHREWEEQLDYELVALFNLVREDGDDIAAVLRALALTPGRFIDLLLSYDSGNVLPDRDTIERTETEMGLLIAVLEVWRAAHPLADIGIETFATASLRMNESHEPMSLPSPNGNGPTTTSRAN